MRANPYKYPFIAIEGIDGCGKSTVIEYLKKWDEENKIGSIFTGEPTNGEWGQNIRSLLKRDRCNYKGEKVSPDDFQKLYIQDRLDHRENEAVFLEKYPIITSRDCLSMVYGIAEGVSLSWLIEQHHKILGERFFIPDLFLILDLSPEEALKRIIKSGRKADYFEKNFEFQKKVRETYLSFPRLISEACPDNEMYIRIINAWPPAEKVFEACLPWIKKIFKEKLEKEEYAAIFESRR